MNSSRVATSRNYLFFKYYLNHSGGPFVKWDRMIKELRREYRNITYRDLDVFLSMCWTMLTKQKCERKGVVVKPLLFKVDLIDYPSQPDD